MDNQFMDDEITEYCGFSILKRMMNNYHFSGS